jgi:hypothetical protein
MTMRRRTVADIFAECDLALATEFLGQENVIGYFANAKGRATLKELSPETFPDGGWKDSADGAPGWQGCARRYAGQSTEAVAVVVSGDAAKHGCRVMVKFEEGEFEPLRLGTLADVPHVGSA